MNDKIIDTPRTRAIGRRLRKAMDDILAEALAHGIAEPRLFFEAEGGVMVMDGDHRGHKVADSCNAAERQEAVVIRVCNMPPGSDVGSW